MQHQDRIEAITGQRVKSARRLSGGMIGTVYRVTLADRTQLVAKVSQQSDSTLDIEGRMLTYLNQHSELPVPQVIHSSADLLLMTFIDNWGGINADVQRDAAVAVARLHQVRGDAFGLAFDTLIGSLHQPNPPYDSWVDFFREQRLLYMADVAHDAGQLPSHIYRQIQAFAPKLDDRLLEPAYPALIHGDMWGGNVLADGQRLAGFVDPAIYYAHPEIELAFTTLFGTFGTPFFERYREIQPIAAGFFEQRRDIYNLYPLLVHVRLFGGGYVGQVARILKQLN